MSYFAHCEFDSGRIVAINSDSRPREGKLAIEIDRDLAVQLMGGHESFSRWRATKVGDGYQLTKVVSAKGPGRRARVDMLPVVEVKIQPAKPIDTTLVLGARLVVVVDRAASMLEIFYDGEHLKQRERPIKLYVTREGDPSYLKCVISVGVNTLDAIKLQNDLESWPNPLLVELADGTTDLSLFAHANSAVQAFEKV